LENSIKPVGKLTIHTLRKSCGRNWADYLPMNVVKELMGHGKVETTLEFYNQVDAQHEEKAARVIQRIIDSGSVGKPEKTDAGTDFAPIWGSGIDDYRRARAYKFITYNTGRYRT
jgi:hypothetical protein